jgi:hypothetical protein
MPERNGNSSTTEVAPSVGYQVFPPLTLVGDKIGKEICKNRSLRMPNENATTEPAENHLWLNERLPFQMGAMEVHSIKSDFGFDVSKDLQVAIVEYAKLSKDAFPKKEPENGL